MSNLSINNLNESLGENLLVNSTLNESTNFSFVNLKLEMVNEIIHSYSSIESWFYLLLMCGFIFLSYKIFSESKKINTFIGSENLEAFYTSFYFYFLLSIISFSYYVLVIFNSFINLSIDFNFWSLILMLISFVSFAWIARTYLLFSILSKFYDLKSNSKSSKNFFLFLNSVLIFVDFIVTIILFMISEYLFVVYNLVLFGGFIYLVSEKGNFKKILKQVPYVTIILLLFLRFVNSFDFFFEDLLPIIYFELIMNLFHFIIYAYIYFKLFGWRKKFEK